MGLFNLDYFKCEAFDLSLRLHTLVGFWPLETNEKWKRFFYSIFSYLCFFSITSMMVILYLDIYLLRNNLSQLSTNLCNTSIGTGITFKGHFLLYKVKLIKQLTNELRDYKNARTDPQDIEILEKSNKQILKVIKTLYSITIPCCIVWIIYPSLESPEKKGIPFPYRLPIEREDWSKAIYFTVYAYHCMALVSFSVVTLSIDGLYFSVIIRICAHYDIIIKNIQTLGSVGSSEKGIEDDVETERAIIVIKENVKLHKKIFREIKMLKECYKAICFVHFCAVGTVIAAIVIDFIISKKIGMQLIQRILFMTVSLWDTFLYSFFTVKLQDKSKELAFAVYSTKWYEMKPVVRKNLLFILWKSQDPPKISIANLFPLDLKTFEQLLKISYNTVALLYQTTKVNST